MFLTKTGNFDIIIIFLRYDLLESLFVYCCNFSHRMVNKMAVFFCEAIVQLQSI